MAVNSISRRKSLGRTVLLNMKLGIDKNVIKTTILLLTIFPSCLSSMFGLLNSLVTIQVSLVGLYVL